MKLTEKQKETICAVYEAAMTINEKFRGQHLLIALEIDEYEKFELTAYAQHGLELTRLANDRVSVYDKDRCFAVINEINDYCEEFLNNKEAAKKARIAQLEKQLADLKAAED